MKRRCNHPNCDQMLTAKSVVDLTSTLHTTSSYIVLDGHGNRQGSKQTHDVYYVCTNGHKTHDQIGEAFCIEIRKALREIKEDEI